MKKPLHWAYYPSNRPQTLRPWGYPPVGVCARGGMRPWGVSARWGIRPWEYPPVVYQNPHKSLFRLSDSNSTGSIYPQRVSTGRYFLYFFFYFFYIFIHFYIFFQIFENNFFFEKYVFQEFEKSAKRYQQRPTGAYPHGRIPPCAGGRGRLAPWKIRSFFWRRM